MVTVAIAGGTGHIGLTLVDVLKESPNHKVIVLSRKAPEEQDVEAPVFTVDYNDVKSVTEILETNGVHTLISAISVITPESGKAEISLVEAAARSSSTRQFIASEYGIPRPKDIPLPQGPVRDATCDALRKTDLQWTRVMCGIFLDYYALPHLKSRFLPNAFGIDVANKAAGIPATGDEPITFTYTYDVARFTVAALDLVEWGPEIFCTGETTTFNKLLKVAEDVRGSKFAVTYDSVEKLKGGEITELPGHAASYTVFPKQLLQQFYSLFGLLAAGGHFEIPDEKSLNKKFPGFTTLKVKEALEGWRGKA